VSGKESRKGQNACQASKNCAIYYHNSTASLKNKERIMKIRGKEYMLFFGLHREDNASCLMDRSINVYMVYLFFGEIMINQINSQLELQTLCYHITRAGLEIVKSSTEKEWGIYGEMLKAVDEAKQWAIGDWLVDGKRHYGDKLYETASRILDSDVNALRQQKSMSEKFELLARANNLSWRHHYEVASIKKLGTDKNGKLTLTDNSDKEAMAKLLEQAETEKLSTRDLANLVSQFKRRQQEEIRLANEPERYSLILADLAWEYDFSKSDSRQVDNHYLPSSQEDMKRLKVPAAEDCVLFMWATSPKLREALELMEAWGFEYKTCMIWVKDQIGMGYYARQKHELLLIGTKGKLELPDPSVRPDSVFNASRTEHSEKPEMVYSMIEKMYPTVKKLEMFTRKQQPGWEVWGDEM
jgi:N6-adenosine-specific RNA methylase IME4